MQTLWWWWWSTQQKKNRFSCARDMIWCCCCLPKLKKKFFFFAAFFKNSSGRWMLFVHVHIQKPLDYTMWTNCIGLPCTYLALMRYQNWSTKRGPIVVVVMFCFSFLIILIHSAMPDSEIFDYKNKWCKIFSFKKRKKDSEWAKRNHQHNKCADKEKKNNKRGWWCWRCYSSRILGMMNRSDKYKLQ